MDQKPLVSVVTIVRNGQEFIADCVSSVRNQTYPNIEHVIVDDNSTDSTVSIIESISGGCKVRLHQSLENLGIPRARNLALSLVDESSQFIAILDADDFSNQARVQSQVEFLLQNPSVALVGSDIEVIDENSNELGCRSYPKLSKDIFDTLHRSNPFCHSAVMVRRSIFEDFGGYDEEYKNCEDYELWFRILKEYNGANLPEALIKYRLQSGQSKATTTKMTLGYSLKARRRNVLLWTLPFGIMAVIRCLIDHLALLLPGKFIYKVGLILYYNQTRAGSVSLKRRSK